MSKLLLRAASVVTAFFTFGHSMGTYSAPSGAQIPVAAAMRAVRFDLFGSDRTYWDLFHGYGVLLIFTAAFLAVLLWLLSRLPREAMRPLALLVALLQVGFSVIAFTAFFWVPGAMNALSAACAAAAWKA